MTTAKQQYRIAYRIGGTENFEWHCIAGRHSGVCLENNRAEIERMGYPTVALADGEPLPVWYAADGWDNGRCPRIAINRENKTNATR